MMSVCQGDQGDRKGRPDNTTKRLAKPVYCTGDQGDREGRPDNTTKRLAKPVYCTGDPRGRPGSLAALVALAHIMY